MKKTLISAAVAAMMAMPVLAQNDNPVVIKGSLIDWYYWGKDYTGSTSGEGWNQQPTGGGAWIDENGVAHSTGAPNIGLLSLTLNPGAPRPLLPEFNIRNTVLYSNCGGVFVGGNTYYSFFGHEVDASMNIDGEYGSENYEIIVRKWTWDGVSDNGLYTNVKYENVGKIYNQPTDLTYDPLNDIIYGVFNIGGGNGYKLGTIDLETFEITWISREAMPLTGELRTLAVNSHGKLFGTDKSGNVYRVSTTDGTLDFVGNMGFKSQEKMMSATFDLRTDKLYWIGYMNDGKKSADTSGTNNTLTIEEGGRDTGLYEINTQTGVATLIGKTDFVDVINQYDENGQLIGAVTNKYGKMQMTGIYVEGSFVKANHDLKVTFKKCPDQMIVNEPDWNNVVVNVKNIGLKSMRGNKYAITFYADDVLLGTIDNYGEDIYTHDIDPGQSYDYYFSYSAPSQPGEQKLSVYVSCEEDEIVANNYAEKGVRILTKQMLAAPVIYGVENDGKLTLSWAHPRGRFIESAENYVPFSYENMGAWIMYDGDKGYTQKANNWNSSIDYPNWSTPKAYIVMDPMKAGFDRAVGGNKFYPHSGDQYFAAWWTAVPDNSEAGGHQIANNDWIISPQLDGLPQEISFWAKGYKGVESAGYETEMNHPELMRVLVTGVEYNSVDDMDESHWAAVVDTFLVNNTEWTQYKATLPQGSRHFALQCCSKEGFVLMLDDISFTLPYKEITGFRVYCNGRRVAMMGNNGFSYTDNAAVPGNVYTVTAVYEEGESQPSNKYVYGVPVVVYGDVNGDGVVDVADIANVIAIMAGETAEASADVNGDGVVDVADIAMIIYLMSTK